MGVGYCSWSMYMCICVHVCVSMLVSFSVNVSNCIYRFVL